MMQIVLCCFYVVLFVLIIFKSSFFRLSGISSVQTAGLFLLKVFAGTLLWKFFTVHYPASDASIFFNDSKIIYDAFFQDPFRFIQLFTGVGDDAVLSAIRSRMQLWNNSYTAFLIQDSRTMIRLNVLFRFISGGYFYVHAILICFLSFTGLVLIYKLFHPYLHRTPLLLIIACFLLPSVLFWSSTVLKEGIIFLGLGLLLYHCQCGLRRSYSYKNIIGMIAGVLLLILVKMYVLLALCPALLANFWIAWSSHRYILLKYATSHLFFLLFIFLLRFLSSSLDFVRIVKNKQTDFINVAKGGMVLFHDSTYIYLNYDEREQRLIPASEHFYKLRKGFRYASFKMGKSDTVLLKGDADTNSFKVLYTYVPAGSAFPIPQLKPNLLEMLKHAPLAFFNTLVIPSLLTFQKAFTGWILLENMVLLLFILTVMGAFLKRRFPLGLVLFCFSFVGILFALIGLTTPVLGALLRYRIPGIPFLMIGCSLLIDEKKCIDFYKRIKSNLFRIRS
jgi:hypothetical protein